MRHLKGAGHVCAPWGHWDGTPLQLSWKLWSESELEARYNWIYVNMLLPYLFLVQLCVCQVRDPWLKKEKERRKGGLFVVQEFFLSTSQSLGSCLLYFHSIHYED